MTPHILQGRQRGWGGGRVEDPATLLVADGIATSGKCQQGPKLVKNQCIHTRPVNFKSPRVWRNWNCSGRRSRTTSRERPPGRRLGACCLTSRRFVEINRNDYHFSVGFSLRMHYETSKGDGQIEIVRCGFSLHIYMYICVYY